MRENHNLIDDEGYLLLAKAVVIQTLRIIRHWDSVMHPNPYKRFDWLIDVRDWAKNDDHMLPHYAMVEEMEISRVRMDIIREVNKALKHVRLAMT